MRRLYAAWLLIWALSVATASDISLDATSTAECFAGCPRVLDLVCGADGNSYQSRCLALCQGVSIAHEGPCVEHEDANARRRRVDTGRLLATVVLPTHVSPEPPPFPSGEPLSQSAGSSSRERRRLSASRRILPEDMNMFVSEGFRLLGVVDMQHHAAPNSKPNKGAPSDSQQQQQQETEQQQKYAALDASAVSQSVRALRITRDGLLYAADYDLAALTAAIKTAAQYSTFGQDEGSESDSNTEPSTGRDKADADESVILEDDVDVCGELPGLPFFDPTAHRRRAQETQPQPARSGGGWQGFMSGLFSTVRRLLRGDGSPLRQAAPLAPRRSLQTSPPPGRVVTAAGNDTAPGNLTTSLASTSSPSPPTTVANMTVCPSSTFPFTAIGQLQLTDANGAYVCSGSLVGTDAVLTAAHCVFRRDGAGGGAFYGQLDFAAGRYNANNRTYNPYNITAWAFATIFNTYETVSDSYVFDWDVAIIRLSAPVGNTAGWLGIASGCPVNSAGQQVQNYAVATAGYPAVLPFGSCNTMSCSVTSDTCQTTAYHTCNSLSGQSGSPFYMQRDFRIRGILVGSFQSGTTPLKVTHIVGANSYSAILKWIAEPLPDQLADTTRDVGIASTGSPPTFPPPPATTRTPPPRAAAPPPPPLDGGNTSGNSTNAVSDAIAVLATAPTGTGTYPGTYPTVPTTTKTSTSVKKDVGAAGAAGAAGKAAHSADKAKSDSAGAGSGTAGVPAVPVGSSGPNKRGKWVRRTRTGSRQGRRLTAFPAPGLLQKQ